MNKKNRFKLPSNNFIFVFCSVVTATILLVSFVIPFVLNYPPGSINTAFDIQMSYIPYYLQFTLGELLGNFLIFVLIKILLKDIDKWYKLPESKKYTDKALIEKIRKKCLKLPYALFTTELLIPSMCAFIVVFLTGSHQFIMFMKLCILLISVGCTVAVVSYILSKELYSKVLADTYKPNCNIGKRINLHKKISIQIFPIIMICILVSFLVGFSTTTSEKRDLMSNFYSYRLNNCFDKNKIYTTEEIMNILSEIPFFEDSDSTFIISPDKSVISNGDITPSNFVIEYTLQLSEQYDGKTYDAYGLDTAGSTIKLQTAQGPVYAGILFNVTSNDILIYYLISAIILIALSIMILFIFTKSLIDDLHFITKKFKDIYKTSDIHLLGNLPIISNDEIGDLSHAFNRIQTLTKENIENIHSKQDMLIERERLASLGQMIGGIAHNLKTPIMSIGGATEGLSDLIKEYDNSIGDVEVTNSDHHEIASEMNEWVTKIKTYTEYMSDVITAVKGQAVRLSDEQIASFTIDDLLKHITILMKHELKNALVDLNIIKNVDTSLQLYGNINILVQVINNIISNAIQAYKKQPNKTIDLEILEKDGYIVFKIRDYASGIPKDVQDKLFKEMITTKGKNGTGLGLFMSYSTIKANFNGKLTFETKIGQGTTFNIQIPKNLNKNQIKNT